MTRKAKDYILIGVIVFLSICIAATSFVIFRNYKDINKLNDKIKHSQTTIEKQTEENNSLKQELEKSKQELETAKQEKATLESENANLKQEITELKAKKEAALKYANLPAAPQNPQPVGKICYLTFDDGPSDNTLKILEILSTYNVKATFFVTNYAQSKIEYLPQTHAAGHTIGLHSNTHKYATIYKSTDAFFKDLNALSDKVFNITGIRSKVIRFPGGGSNKVSKSICKGIMTRLTNQVRIQGYAYFDWNVDSGDAASKGVTAKSITDNVLNAAAKKDSICVLMHDISSKKATVEALPQILEGLKKMGYTFEPLTEKSYGYCHKVNN